MKFSIGDKIQDPKMFGYRIFIIISPMKTIYAPEDENSVVDCEGDYWGKHEGLDFPVCIGPGDDFVLVKER